jgi:hypothetical protein
MSQSVRDFERSKTADNAITAYQVVKITSTGIDVATSNSDAIVGVAQMAAAATEQCTYRFIGTTKAIASAAISAGAKVTATTAGKVVTTTTDHHTVLGVALEAASADGDIIEVQLGIYTLSA